MNLSHQRCVSASTVSAFYRAREGILISLKRIVIAALILTSLIFSKQWLEGISASSQGKVYVARIASSINPAVSDYLERALEKSEKERGAVLIVQLDTPGGLDTSMRAIIKNIMNSPLPVVVYVSPQGARAASAGVLITLASDVAVMAPGTNIGAAHPVSVGKDKAGSHMAQKIENDAAAYARSIAEKKGRNALWAEDAVRKSVSLTEKEAFKENVIDLVARDMGELLEKMDGMVVRKNGVDYPVATKGIEVVSIPMGWRHRILNTLSDPNVAYILLMLGIYGVFFEFYHPGAIFPGVIGGICIILGFYALQTLPVNYAGFLLIGLALILFILEVKVQSFGMLSVGGIVSLFLGSIMLFHSKEAYLAISMYTIIGMVMLSALFFGLVAYLALQAQKIAPRTGFDGIIGSPGTALGDFGEKGKVLVSGEIWDALSDAYVRRGDEVKVTGVEGFILKVSPKSESNHGEGHPTGEK